MHEYLLNVFTNPRAHRWATVPACIAILAALPTSGALVYCVLLVPPVFALPFIAHAAVRQTDRATARALSAVRFSAVVTGLIGLVGLTGSPAGLVWLGAAGLQLVAAWDDDERCLGAATIVIGVLLGAAALMVMWLGAVPQRAVLGAGLLVAGGALWVIEAQRRPLRDDFPAMTIAA